MERRSNKLLVAILLFCCGVAYVMGRVTAPVPPAPPLPPDTSVVKIVKEIVPGPEIIKEVPGPVRVVERIKWKTKIQEVEVPVIREVATVVERAVELGTLQSMVDLDADKFEGLVNDTLSWGWRGRARCLIRASHNDDWTVILDQPLDLSASTSISSLRPQPKKRPWGLDLRLGVVSSPGVDLSAAWGRGRLRPYLGAQYDLDPEALITFDSDSLRHLEADRFRFYGGVQWTLGRR